MRIRRSLPQLFDPWLITEAGMRLVMNVASRDDLFHDERIKALAARAGEPLKNTRTVEVRNGVAVIGVEGPIVRHADMFSDISGATSTAQIARDFTRAMEDPQVSAILLDIDSPGGEANGIAELVAMMAAQRDRKPMKAYVGGTGASAAYWIASAASEIVVAPSSWTGSVGAVMAFLDTSASDAAAGVKEIKFISSVSPLKHIDPASERGGALYQDRVNKLGALFVADVAMRRGVPVERALLDFGQGDVLIGADAVAGKLADRLGDFESLLTEMASANTGRSFFSMGAASMNPTQIAAALGMPETATEADILTRAAALTRVERAVVASAGAESADAALGIIGAAMESHAAIQGVRAELAGIRAESVRRDFASTLAGLSLGQMRKGMIAMVASLDADKGAAMRAALDAIPESVDGSERDAAIDALASVPVTPQIVAIVRAYAAEAPAVSATPRVEPARPDIANAEGIDPARAAAIDAAFGRKPADVEQFLKSRSAAQ